MYNSLHLLVPNSLNSCLFIYFIFGCVGSSLLHMAFSSCGTDVENKRMNTKGGKWRWGGGGVMNWDIGIDICTLMCIKWITNKNLLYKK